MFNVWAETFPRMERFIYWTSYLFCFQSFRLSFCQLGNKPHYDASMKTVDLVLIKLNRFSFFHILLVLFPTISACIYNLFWTRYLRQVFWHDIEMMVMMIVLIVAIVLDVWTKDESALEENYIDKKEFSKNIDITNKSLMTQTILHTKDDIPTSRYFKKDFEVHGKQLEEEEIRKAYYNRFGQEVNQKVMNFNNLINKPQEEEVVSQESYHGVNKE